MQHITHTTTPNNLDALFAAARAEAGAGSPLKSLKTGASAMKKIAVMMGYLCLLVGVQGCVDDAASDVDPNTPNPGFVLVEIDSIDDLEGFGAYSMAAGPTLVAHNFIPVAATPVVERLEGSSPDAWSVVIQFSDLDAAQSWYDDPDYAAARPLRFNSTGSTHFALVEGVAGAATVDHTALTNTLHLHVDTVTDVAAFDDYRVTLAASLQRHGAILLVDTADSMVVEGDQAYGWTILAGFPSERALQQWRDDPETDTANGVRATASTGVSAVVLPAFDPSMFE